MSLLSRFFGGSKPGAGSGRRALVIGLDGVPHSLLSRLIADGDMPNLATIAGSGELRQATSTYPAVSCAAWTSFVTGVNPGAHGVFGFTDIRPGTYELHITGSNYVTSPPLWRMLNERGHRAIVMNVPVTFPPPQVDGLLVSGFLAPELKGATHPPELAGRLAALGYRIDIDPWKARQSLDALLEDLDLTLKGRVAGAVELLTRERWSFGMVHIMGTDRANHFMWGKWASGDEQYAPRFLDYYRKVDAAVGEIAAAAGEETELLLLSDHGFTETEHELNLDVWLRERGYLGVPASAEAKLTDIDESTRAFSMTPGRIYLNVRGRQPRGSVEPGSEYEALRKEIIAGLREIAHPDTGEPVMEHVFRREEIFHGESVQRAPDLLAHPVNGIDLKSSLGGAELFGHSPITGMHTYDDAFWLVRGRGFGDGTPQVHDGAATVLALLGEEPPDHLDGRSAIG
ncbi:MAG TPA: alkaline phosphatase family protein [Armatimonadota bacterium]|nr:alkaline phosphatase family protein [Armatimonadota bacterium]